MQDASFMKKVQGRDDRGGRGLAGWVVTRVAAWREKSGRARELELMETLALGGRRQLMLVRFAGGRFLVGCGADGVQSIVRADVNERSTESDRAL